MSFCKTTLKFVVFVHFLAVAVRQGSAQDNTDNEQEDNGLLPEHGLSEHAAGSPEVLLRDDAMPTSSSEERQSANPEFAQEPSDVPRYSRAKFRNAVRKSEREQEVPPPRHVLTPSERENFEVSMLEAHNANRRKHCARPLKRSDSLTAAAQAWADELARSNYLFPNPHNSQGQNCIWLKYKDGQMATGTLVTKLWYDEVDLYDYRNPSINLDVGHFTQLVWKSSREIGIGMAQADDGKWYYVANYSPIGNVKAELAQNVLRPTCS